MPPRLSQTTGSSQKAAKKTSLKVNSLNLEAKSNPAKRLNPLTAFVNVPPSQSSQASQEPAKPQPKSKGKGKEKEVIDLTGDEEVQPRPRSQATQTTSTGKHGARKQTTHVQNAVPTAAHLWVDLYEPVTEEDLAVHKRKVSDVRGWLTEAFSARNKFRRILALTGPAGTAKTTTLRILSRELDFEILEWSGTAGHSSTFGSEHHLADYDDDALFAKFESFLARASSCQNLFAERAQSSSKAKRQLLLLEDLPNILHGDTKSRFHAAIQSLVDSAGDYPVPLVFIISDSGIRGEASDERQASGSWGKDRDVLDVRTVIPPDLLHGPYVTQMRFNPIAVTFLKKALQALLTRHFGPSKAAQPSKEILDTIVDSSNGDIRSAVNALQFSCVATKKKKGKGRDVVAVMESVTRREQSLALFHLMGKVLYNKRKGDPPTASATAKDIQRDKDLDAALMDAKPLPTFLANHERRTSRVNVDTLYADSPIDSSLFSLYIHQNYAQFCQDIDELDGISDNLSWVDSSGGEAWYQANPHRFHLLTMGTLHSLPSPVVRKSQKICKPDFFDNLNSEKDAWAGVLDVRRWLVDATVRNEDGGWRVGGWSRKDVAMEVGGVLKARDATSAALLKAPLSHRSFSGMRFVLGNSGAGAQLGETEGDEHDVSFDLDETVFGEEEDNAAKKGGWLDGDDIEDF